MTDAFRCPHCTTLLDTAALLTAGECGCRSRPSKHDFDPDPANEGATCLTCGEPFYFGALHVDDSPVVDVPDSPPECPRCTHYAHDRGECRVVIVRWPKTVACGCEAA